MKRFFLIAGAASSGNRLLASILVTCGCHGSGSTDQDLNDVIGNDNAVYIKHHPDYTFYQLLNDHGYNLTVLVPVRDEFCAEQSRLLKNFPDEDYSYRELFEGIPEDAEVIMVPYESLVLHGAQKLVERLGFKYTRGPIQVDNHSAPMIYDGNAKHYRKSRPEDQAFFGEDLVWLPEKGIGFYPVTASPYDDNYFQKYIRYADTIIGKKITTERVRFVKKHYDGPLADIGIGCGNFIENRPDTFGFDIMPAAIDWLQERELFVDPRYSEFPAASFWDSLEHMNNPDQILQYITDYVFVSMPIYDDAEHVLRSKHFRKDEHCLYFTEDGFVMWMDGKGFDLLEKDDFESRVGREDILTFAFKRRKK